MWICTACNQLGQGMQQVLLGWLIFDMTDSSAMVGVLFAVRSAPNLFVGLAAGSFADWLDRRSLMRVSVGGMALVALVMAALLFTGSLRVWELMLSAFLLGGLQAFHMAARQAYAYDIVGPSAAVNGIALITMAQRIGGIIGAVLAGVLIHVWGPGTAFVAMAAAYTLGTLGLLRLRYPGESAPIEKQPVLENLRSYFKELRSNRTLLSLIVTTGAAEVVGFSHQAILPVLARDVLHIGALGLGVLTAFRFLGGALGVVIIAALGGIQRRGLLLLAILAMFGVSQMLLSRAPGFEIALLLVMLVNSMGSATDILHHTLLQLSVPNEQRGRAMGSWIMGTGMAPVGHLEIGYVATVASARIALLTNGIALAALAVLMLLAMPRIRRL